MKRKRATREELDRLESVRSLPCIACQMFGVFRQPFKTEAHHQNLDGKAGQKRLGHFHTVPLCRWHHQGSVIPGVTGIVMGELYGPSLAKQSKRFRELFGDDNSLLERTNALLAKERAA